MNDTENLSRSLQRYTGVLRRQWWVTALVTAIALIVAAAYVATATPVYSASSKVVVGQGQTLFEPGLSVDYTAVTSTISSLLQSNIVANQTIRTLHLKSTPTSLLSNLSVNAQPDGAVINIVYDSPNQPQAVRVLGTLTSIFTSLVNTQLARTTHPVAGTAATPPVSAVIFDPAHADPGKVSPHTSRTLVIALVLGLVAGLLLAFLRDAFSGTFKTEEEATAAFGATSLGSVPRGALGIGVFQLAGLPRTTRIRTAEAFQMLVARLRYSSGLPRGVIVVISAQPEDGKTTTAAFIASELASADHDVIGVEADLHRPALHRLFGMPSGLPGILELGETGRTLTTSLAAVTEESATVTASQGGRLRATVGGGRDDDAPVANGDSAEDVVNRTLGSGRLRLLPAGTRGQVAATQMLSSENVSSLMARLRSLADYVVVDTPPLLLSGDAYPFVQQADAVVVVCRRGATRHNQALRCRDILRSLGVRDYSLVFTEADVAEDLYYGYQVS